MYHALYRKYRPVDFNSVVGQDSIIKTLKNSIINSNFSHAYMFFGPRGTGKTTVSKVFARNINCLSPIDGNACHECEACKVSFSHECVDIIEIDAASNNGVDEIRELKNNINLVPAELRYKVYIIDEVHMLSTGAFNALLKTLEEPPEHVIFILATTDPQKVPETIISRCQCFSFKRLSDSVIRDRLSFVSKTEGIDIDSVVLDKIALLSNGGMRDALGSLDKMISYTSSHITIAEFNEVNGVISDEEIASFINNVMSGNIKDVLSDISLFNDSGKNLIQILTQIINYVRDLIVNYYLNNLDVVYSIDLLQEFINSLNEKMFDIKRSGNTKIYIEMFIIKFINNNIFVERLTKNDAVDKKNLDNVVNNSLNSTTKVEKVNDDFKIDTSSAREEKKLDDISLGGDDRHSIIPKIININDVIDARINNTMATADKNLLKLEISNYNLLSDYSFDQEIGAVVNALLDSKLRACGTDDIIISYSSDAVVEQNLENIVILNDVYNKITNSNKNIAIVSDDKWNVIKNDYIKNLKENIQYKVVKEPDIVFEEINKNDIITSSAIDLFGEDIVEVE